MKVLCLRSLLTVAVLGFVFPAAAQMPFPGWIIPVVVSAPGQNDTSWASDLFITNLGTEDVVLSAHYFKGGRANTFNGTFAKPNITVAAGNTVQVNDVVRTWFPNEGSNTKGWLFIADTSPVNCNDEERDLAKLVVSTRIYNQAGFGGTFGQIMEAQMNSINTSQYPSVFTGIRNQGMAQPGFRTNVGVVNLSESSMIIKFKLFNRIGAAIGNVNKTIKALSMEQYSMDDLGFRSFGPLGGRLEVSLVNPNVDPCETSDEVPVCIDRCADQCNGKYGFGQARGFIAYASNVDNLTGDGEALLPVVDQLKYFEYISDYIDANCPDKNYGRPFPISLIESVLIDRQNRAPVFRKVE